MESLSAYNFHLSYRRGQDNTNADFLFRLPLLPNEEVSDSSALSDPDLGVYLIRTCGYITPPCLIPGVGLGGLVPSSYLAPGAGLGGLASPMVSPLLSGLPLTNDDFQTHHAPMPTPYMIGSSNHPYAASPKQACPSFAVRARDDTPWSCCSPRTQSQLAILISNVPSHPNYRTAARSGFAAFAAPASLPKPQLRPSLPPRLVRPGSMIPLSHLALPRPSPVSCIPQLGPSTPVAPSTLHTTALNPDVYAAAARLSNTLFSYSPRDSDQAQRKDPPCDATCCCKQVDPPPPSPSLLESTFPRMRSPKPQT